MTDIMEIETWAEMTDRFALERAEAVMALADKGLTQTEAAMALDTNPRALNNYLRRNDLHWPVIRQGFKSRTHKETYQ